LKDLKIWGYNPLAGHPSLYPIFLLFVLIFLVLMC
jgi:hypothetical protein